MLDCPGSERGQRRRTKCSQPFHPKPNHIDPEKSTRRTITRPQNEQLRHWFPSLPFQQFQVLFNSLFKVLCIFPSRYLFAIGLPPIFSFRWNLPPNLSCNPKQLDSDKRSPSAEPKKQTGLSPSLIPCSKGLIPGSAHGHAWHNTQKGLATWAIPASVALTEGILVSFFSSA